MRGAWLVLAALAAAPLRVIALPSTPGRAAPEPGARPVRYVSAQAYLHAMRAEVLLARGEPEAAAEALTLALVYDPEAYRVHVQLAALALELGRGARVDRLLTRAIELRPRGPTAWRLRGVLLEREGREREALQSYERAASLAPSSADGIDAARAYGALAGPPARALELARRAAEHAPRAVAALGALEAARGQLEAAATAFARGAARFPGDARLVSDAIEALARAGRFAEAYLLARPRAELSEPARAEAYALALAAELPREAEALLAGVPEPWRRRAAHAAGGSSARLDADAPELCRASILPREAAAPSAPAELRYGSLVRAEQALERAVTATTAAPEDVATLARLRAARGVKLVDAEAVARGALARQPDHAGLLAALGRVLLARGQREPARRLLERAAWLAPEDPLVLEPLGDARRAAGAKLPARAAYARAIAVLARAAPDPGVSARLSRVQAKLGAP